MPLIHEVDEMQFVELEDSNSEDEVAYSQQME